jgi:hypothetical protein
LIISPTSTISTTNAHAHDDPFEFGQFSLGRDSATRTDIHGPSNKYANAIFMGLLSQLHPFDVI